MRHLIDELYLLLEPDAFELGFLNELQGILRIAEYGTSSDRQLAVFEAAGGVNNLDEALRAVAESIAIETAADLDMTGPAPASTEAKT